jgi:hypothetical protein
LVIITLVDLAFKKNTASKLGPHAKTLFTETPDLGNDIMRVGDGGTHKKGRMWCGCGKWAHQQSPLSPLAVARCAARCALQVLGRGVQPEQKNLFGNYEATPCVIIQCPALRA